MTSKETDQKIKTLELMKQCGDISKEQLKELEQLKMDEFYSGM